MSAAKRWYWIVGAASFLAGSLVWELRADYRLTPQAQALPGSLPEAMAQPEAERRGFLIIVRPARRRCEVRDSAGQLAASFACEPAAGWR